MARYEVVANVDQIVTKTIRLLVSANSEEEAQDKSRAALAEYPKPIPDTGIERILTIKSNYWIPKSIDFVSTTVEPTITDKSA